jgi:acetylornithine deacetylase/succinyl-diaminopimelate desuccinylase-like protein
LEQFVPRARARINLRVPPGMDAIAAWDALVAHLESVAPWHARVTVDRESDGQPFTGSTSGTAYEAMVRAMADVYGRDPVL